MRGRYYLKHTINHMVSDAQRNKGTKLSLEDKVKKVTDYLTTIKLDSPIEEKARILKNNNNDLSLHEIHLVLVNLNDEELCKAYSYRSLDQIKKSIERTKTLFKFTVASIVFFLLVLFYVSV